MKARIHAEVSTDSSLEWTVSTVNLAVDTQTRVRIQIHAELSTDSSLKRTAPRSTSQSTQIRARIHILAAEHRFKFEMNIRAVNLADDTQMEARTQIHASGQI